MLCIHRNVNMTQVIYSFCHIHVFVVYKFHSIYIIKKILFLLLCHQSFCFFENVLFQNSPIFVYEWKLIITSGIVVVYEHVGSDFVKRFFVLGQRGPVNIVNRVDITVVPDGKSSAVKYLSNCRGVSIMWAYIIVMPPLSPCIQSWGTMAGSRKTIILSSLVVDFSARPCRPIVAFTTPFHSSPAMSHHLLLGGLSPFST